MDDKIVGKCTQMCPEDEVAMREHNRLVHILEMLPVAENRRKSKADRLCMVKAFSRSAAGQSMPAPKDLRTPNTLLRTINYLLFDIVTISTLPWIIIYDFIVDRLLAVRQDAVVQRLSIAHNISILQPIVRFHAFAAYRLCDEPITKFDAVLNNKHLQECLKKLLTLYDECDQFLDKSGELVSVDEYEELFAKSRPCMEALYILFNLGDVNAIRRALDLPKRYRTEIVENCLKISLCFVNGNWIKVCRLMRDLPPVLAGIGALHLPGIRKFALQVMSVAYSCKNLTFPAGEIMTWLLYSDRQDFVADCNYYNVNYDETTNVIHFDKAKFNESTKTCSRRRESFVAEKLCGRSIPSLVLYDETF